MDDRTRDLIDIAIATYREEILPDLPPHKRYVGAMIANAAEIARRRLASEDPARSLLAFIYGTEPAHLARLARDIRTGQVSEASHAALAPALLRYLQAELEITNPKFLERRRS